MNETRSILAAYSQARARGATCALATVTHVEGSSYRRVGARMLVADDGRWIGCVSGGCLERDLLRKAAWAMENGEPLLATYDTREDGDERHAPRAGLGCNGVIEILVEPIPTGASHAVLELMSQCFSARRSCGVILFPHDRSHRAITWQEELFPSAAPDYVRSVWEANRGRNRAMGLDCLVDGGRRRIFFEAMHPTAQVTVIGAGYDSVAMAALGVQLGYDVTVVDFRSGLPIPRAAFDGIARYIQCAPAHLPAHLPVDDHSVVILMTHQAQDDIAVLPYLLDGRPAYLGLLGPRKRAQKLLAACGRENALAQPNFHAPVGLDVGSETPTEIALAVFAEIQAATRGHAGGSLRDLAGPIHARDCA